MDFKWTLSRPGIALEFETGSIKEAIGLLEEEGTQISEVFGFTMGAQKQPEQPSAPATDAEPKTREPRAPKVEAVAPPPLPIPAVAPAAPPPPAVAPVITVLPPNQMQPATDDGIPAALKRDANNELPSLPAPPVVPAPPPVGVLGPKVVAALERHREGKPDGGQALADWLAAAGLTIPGKTFDEACRVVLMTSDEKLKAVAEAFGVTA
jgi:hypothetical protein